MFQLIPIYFPYIVLTYKCVLNLNIAIEIRIRSAYINGQLNLEYVKYLNFNIQNDHQGGTHLHD